MSAHSSSAPRLEPSRHQPRDCLYLHGSGEPLSDAPKQADRLQFWEKVWRPGGRCQSGTCYPPISQLDHDLLFRLTASQADAPTTCPIPLPAEGIECWVKTQSKAPSSKTPPQAVGAPTCFPPAGAPRSLRYHAPEPGLRVAVGTELACPSSHSRHQGQSTLWVLVSSTLTDGIYLRGRLCRADLQVRGVAQSQSPSWLWGTLRWIKRVSVTTLVHKSSSLTLQKWPWTLCAASEGKRSGTQAPGSGGAASLPRVDPTQAWQLRVRPTSP